MHRAQGVLLSLRMLQRRRPLEGAELLPRVPRLGAIGPDREAEASELGNAELQVLGGALWRRESRNTKLRAGAHSHVGDER